MKYFLIIFILLSFYLSEAKTTIDSLTNELTNYSKDDTIKANLLQDLAWEYVRTEPNKSILFSNKLIALSKKINYPIGEANGNSNKATAFQYLTEYDSSIYYHEKALEIRKAINDQYGVAVSYNNLGIIYTSQNKFKNALDLWLKSISIKEKLLKEENTENLRISIGYAYGNISSLFSNMENNKKAIEYIKKSINILKKTNDKWGQMMGYGNLANEMKKTGNFNEAFLLYDTAIVYAKNLESTFDLSLHLYNYGEALSEFGKYNEAESKINEALALQKKIEDNEGIALSYLTLSGIKRAQNDDKLAIEYGNKALEIGLQYKLAMYYEELYQNLIELYKELNLYEEAFNLSESKTFLQDSLRELAKEEGLLELEAKYKGEKKEKELIERERELAISTLQNRNQQYIIFGIILIAALIIIFTVILYSRLKVTRQQKLLIQQKNKENELLLGEIHHRVKNNLQVISSLLSLQERSIDDVATKSAIAEGKERVRSMGLIHKMLYQNDNYSGVEMDNYGKELIGGLIDSFGMKKSDIDVNLNFSQLKLDIDTAIPIGLIINELVINTLKYAYKETSSPSLKVSLINQSEHLVLEVKDNGNGKVENLENSKSFGMKLINSLSRQIGGTVSIQSTAGICVSINIANYKLI